MAVTFGEGNAGRRDDPKWIVQCKWLLTLQAGLGNSALAANNPDRADGVRVLREKILCAKDGVSYHG